MFCGTQHRKAKHCRAHSQHQVPDAGKTQQAPERLQRQNIAQKNKTRAVCDLSLIHI